MTFISFFISSVIILAHPLHISVTEIALDPKERELEITLRVFTDDLELAIREMKNDQALNLLKPVNSTIDKLAWEYLQSKLKISTDRAPRTIKYLGHEMDDDVLIFYIQVEPIENFETLSITNSVLTELYDDQANLVNVTVKEQTKSLRLIRNNPSGTVSFEQK